MDTGFRTPWLDLFRRGEVEFDVRQQAAQGLLAPRPAEQLALLVLLTADADSAVAACAEETLRSIPQGRIEGLLARSDAPTDLRSFFETRGVLPAAVPDEDLERPLVDLGTPPAGEEAAAPDASSESDARPGALQKIAQMSVPQRLGLAMKGTREERAILIRDPNKLVSLAVLSSPKLSETEVEAIARMTNVTEEVPRTIASTRAWIKSYAICVALVKNPKTPVAVSMNLLSRLNDRDMRGISTDRNVPEVLRTTARKKLVIEKR